MLKLFRRSKNKKVEAANRSQFNYDRDPRYAPLSPDFQRNGNGYHSYGNDFRQDVFAPWLQLPIPVVQRIFAFVCPHSTDESYETCEQSAIEDACMLCDLRDLAHAGMVCKTWRKAAVPLLIRIDTVHYCDLEITLSEKRKRRTRFDRNGIPEDPSSARLQLLCRTVREDPTRLGKLVQFFKTPYMLRESNTADLARTIAVLPNLRYLDLPEGVFVDEPQYATLRLEVQARCPDLRKMTYLSGSERSLEQLSTGIIWPNLEVLELGKINMDPQILRQVLATLQRLRALKVTNMTVFDDEIFQHNDMLPPIPALEELILNQTPRVTSAGVVAYLSRRDVQSTLKVLSFNETGVHAQSIQEVLASAPRLQTISLIEEVDSAFPSMNNAIPPLASRSLQTLRYEITAKPTAHSYAGMTQGYYRYLASSLFAGGFPMLTALYVRDETFPDLLLGLPLPAPGFAGGVARPGSSGSIGMFSMGSSGSLSPNNTAGFGGSSNNRFSSNNPFANATGLNGNGLGPPMLNLNQTLAVYTKGDDDIDWGIITMDPVDNPAYGRGRSGSRSYGSHERSNSASGGQRPLSHYGLADVGGGWREGAGGSRKSIIVSNGPGGFLALPGGSPSPKKGNQAAVDEWPRPKSSSGGKKDRDLWR
ncbi:hypothetical protein BX600DRAFT_441210 [Xylariales sp. PMI_506]|nr:hypothetical protein BX600DRAFT_441210 [Xylariales sp. PMI_506]